MKKYNIEQLRGAWGAGVYSKNSDKESQKQEGIVGKWFHSFTEAGELHWQGQILAPEPNNYFSVQLYSWIDGRPTQIKLVPFSQMIDWNFYISNEEMINYFSGHKK